MISHFLGVLDNSILQGMGYGIAVLGIAVAFRVLKYPDLTADGSFLLGATVFAAVLATGRSWCVAIAAATLTGAITGIVTALLHTKARVNRLLSGILTAMMCYSASFWVLRGKSNVKLTDYTTMFSIFERVDASAPWSLFGVHLTMIGASVLIALMIGSVVLLVLKTDFGITLRATGENAALVEELGRSPQGYIVAGLAISNALVALAGALIAARQGFADVNMGFGVIITLVAALVIGEETARMIRCDPLRRMSGRVVSGPLGACVYFFLYLVILRASILGLIPIRIQPTDLKLISAVIVVFFVLMRYHRRQDSAKDELLPL